MKENPIGYELTSAERFVNVLRHNPEMAFPNVRWNVDDFRGRNIVTTFTFDRMVSRAIELQGKSALLDLEKEERYVQQFEITYRCRSNKVLKEGLLISQQKRYSLFDKSGRAIEDPRIYTPYVTVGLYGFDADHRAIGIELTRYRKTPSKTLDIYLLLEGKDMLDELRDPMLQLTINDILEASGHYTQKLFVGDPGLNDDFQYETAKRLGL